MRDPRALVGVFCVALGACDDVTFPRDPDGTLREVLATRSVTVAAADHVPWVIVDGAAPAGAEVELVEAFARDLGVEVEWMRMQAFEALDALERGDADLAIGGFTRQVVSGHAGAAPTFVYFREALVVGSRSGMEVPERLDGRGVFVPPGLAAEGLVRRKGGVPVEEMTEAVDLVVLPDWQVAALDVVPTGIMLQRQDHVLAIPQGENAWAMRLERFLREEAGDVAERLRDHAR